MRTKATKHIVKLVAALAVGFSCNTAQKEKKAELPTSPYLNHSDTARYVGMQTCKQCHQSTFESFQKTGMGKSLGLATMQKSAADFSRASIFDAYTGFNYRAAFVHDSLFITEFRTEKKDTLHKRVEQVNFIVGSGQHTNSHLRVINGYVHQMPMTYYTQSKKWDLPPGFENGVNTRFGRKIGLECMSCHNAFPNFVQGSENKYTKIPQGIDCERCHGPGSIHVAERSSKAPIDTSKYIDYSIVNPSKLPLDRQFDICMRCHLQGNTVLKEGKSFFDFKPGMVLSDYMSTFLPRFEHADEEFIMASHADRLKQSACFIKSLPKAAGDAALRPYKGALTCITCHNPHVSVKETNPNVFNEACNSCHAATATKDLHLKAEVSKFENCVSCHMPKSGSSDIPHVTVHDHYIRKPISQREKNAIKKFIGLAAINEKHPGANTRAMAYVLQYERFEPKAYYLDSAAFWLNKVPDGLSKLQIGIHLQYVSQNFKQLTQVLNLYGVEKAYADLNLKALDNKQAWTAYRISEAYSTTGDNSAAQKWINLACNLAPYQLEFRNKKGNLLAAQNKVAEAQVEFEFVLKEFPQNIQALVNLGYLQLLQGRAGAAAECYSKAYALDPDYENLLLNYAGYWLYLGNKAEAVKMLKHCLRKHPQNQKAKLILAQINNTHV